MENKQIEDKFNLEIEAIRVESIELEKQIHRLTLENEEMEELNVKNKVFEDRVIGGVNSELIKYKKLYNDNNQVEQEIAELDKAYSIRKVNHSGLKEGSSQNRSKDYNYTDEDYDKSFRETIKQRKDRKASFNHQQI